MAGLVPAIPLRMALASPSGITGTRASRGPVMTADLASISVDRTLTAVRFFQPELVPPRRRGVDVGLIRPNLGREARTIQLGVGVVIEIHRGVDQHPVPLAGAEKRRVAVALAGRGIEARAEGRRHDDDGVLAGID